jgi:uncharacterized RDD family membrane protein YckC
VPGELADPRLRIVGGLIDFFILGVFIVAVNRVTNDTLGLLTIVFSVVLYVAYFGILLSQRGQTVGMMVFRFKVRDQATKRYPDIVASGLRGLACWLELGLCLIGAVGWLWMLRDPQRQAIHDKIASTIVTTS